MIRTYLLTPGLDRPRADPSNEGLRAEVNSPVRLFTVGLDLLPPTFQTHRAAQTDPEAQFMGEKMPILK